MCTKFFKEQETVSYRCTKNMALRFLRFTSANDKVVKEFLRTNGKMYFFFVFQRIFLFLSRAFSLLQMPRIEKTEEERSQSRSSTPPTPPAKRAQSKRKSPSEEEWRRGGRRVRREANPWFMAIFVVFFFVGFKSQLY